MSDEMEEIVNEFITEAEETLEKIDPLFIELEKKGDDKELLNEIFRSMHTLKGAAGFLGFQNIVDVAHRSESIMKKIRDGELALSRHLIDVVLKSVDVLKELISCIREKREYAGELSIFLKDVDLALQDAENRKTQVVEDVQNIINEGQQETIARSDEKQEIKNEVEQKQSISQISQIDTSHKDKEVMANLRVEVSKIDKVMDLAGEIVLIRNRLVNLSNNIDKDSIQNYIEQLLETTGFLDRVTSDLQLSVMKIRMQPIQKVFSKFPRMVRDLSKTLGKEIELEIFGEDTEVDKTVIENIADPLVHIIRNSIDHGIELPEERIKKGKGHKGKITINAYQKGSQIVIDITDDGKGIDVDAVKNKAIQRELITDEETKKMSDEDIINLIFLPGFSTKEVASELSGRGVGMDVVRTNVAKLNGYVEVISKKDIGSTFRISLPLTLAIIQSMMVKVGREVYAIPQTMIEETLRIKTSEIKDVTGQKVLNIRGKVLPLFYLKDLLNVPDDESTDNLYSYILVASVGDKKFCLIVNGLLGQEEVVIKTINGVDADQCGILGATIRGDGKVVLIIDLAILMRWMFKKH